MKYLIKAPVGSDVPDFMDCINRKVGDVSGGADSSK